MGNSTYQQWGCEVTRSFGDLARELKEAWSPEAQRAFDDASAAFALEMEARRNLGNSIRDARRTRGMTQTDLATAAAVQQAEISRIERGIGNPTVATLHRLAAALGRRVAFEALTSGR